MILMNRIACGELMMGGNLAAIQQLESAINLSYDAEPSLRPNEVAPFRRLVIELKTNLIRAWLRVAEAENCINCRNGEACVFPIQGGGIHSSKDGAKAAIALIKSRLEEDPKDLQMKWLLNLMAMSIGQFPGEVPEQFRIADNKLIAAHDFPKFQEIGSDLLVDFT